MRLLRLLKKRKKRPNKRRYYVLFAKSSVKLWCITVLIALGSMFAFTVSTDILNIAMRQ